MMLDPGKTGSGAIRTLRATGLLLTLVVGSACSDSGSQSPVTVAPRMTASANAERAARSRLFARATIWNPAPGDPALPTMSSIPSAPSGTVSPPMPAPASVPATAPAQTTLVLYDTTGSWGYLGELYAIGAANLASHFGAWIAKPVSSYACGDALAYRAILYIGSTYDEPLPTCMLDDILNTTRPVVWSFYNLWQLSARATEATFATRYGFSWVGLDFTTVNGVRYKGHTLHRYGANAAGILNLTIRDPAIATVLAQAVRADGTTFPWATRARNLTYVGDVPFAYMSEEDRMLVYADLLFDALAPTTPERHRAIVRIEDISPSSDPAELRAVADLLYSRGVPFGFGVTPEYTDPLGYYNGGTSDHATLAQTRPVADALRYMQSRGGVMVLHGQTHQWDRRINPYTAVTGDDEEFYRVTENLDHSLNFVGPVPGDSLTWAGRRLTRGAELLRLAGFTRPTIFEVPHYAASATDYRAIAQQFTTRWDRTLYFNGLLRGGTVSYSVIFGQLFPYVVRDVYGTRVLPESLGNVEPEPFYIYPTRFPSQIIAAADDTLVVRDGVAGFYFHPFFSISYLRETVDGIRALGYQFVSPTALESP